jgi:hypothetical protein
MARASWWSWTTAAAGAPPPPPPPPLPPPLVASLFHQPSDTGTDFITYVQKLQGAPISNRVMLMTHSGCCGFGNTLGAVQSSFVLALLTNCTWMTNSRYMSHFDSPWSRPWFALHERKASRRTALGFHGELRGFQNFSFGSSTMNRSLARSQLAKDGHATFILRADRAVDVDKFITWLVSVDDSARRNLGELLRQAMLDVMHPSGLEAWAPWREPNLTKALNVLRAPVVRLLCSRPSSRLRSAIQDLESQLIASSSAAAQKGDRTCLDANAVDRKRVQSQPRSAFDATMAVQIRTLLDASNYNAKHSYDHFWPCVTYAALKLAQDLRRVVGHSRQPRVLVWFTSDDLVRLVPRFFSALRVLSRYNVTLAAPSCHPIPRGSRQAQDSRHGNVDAIAHWWALGAADAMVVSGTTYSYSAWLRADRAGRRNLGLDLWPRKTQVSPNSVDTACTRWSSSVHWR